MGAPTNQPIPLGGGMGGPPPDQNAENIQREFERYASGINDLMPVPPQQGLQQMSTIGGPMPKSTIGGPIPESTIGGPIPAQMDQQKMQAFQNFLNQGINNMASINQAPASNPASTQPRMQKATQAPRKFSTVSNSPARFG